MPFQVLGANPKPSPISALTAALSKSLPKELESLASHTQTRKENKALGIPEDVQDPEMRKQYYANKNKTPAIDSIAEEAKKAKTISDYFGPEAGDIYQSLPEGGKTKFFENIFQSAQRGQSTSDFIRGFKQEMEGAAPQNSPREKGQEATAPQGGFKFPALEPEKGVTPAEKIKIKRDREKANLPIYQESVSKYKAHQSEQMLTDRLTQLNESDKIPQDFARVIINPSTGKPYALAELAGKVNPETQLFVKTLNDFTTKAKDTYGSRVTNFDLEQFMARLPSLLNTTEGRRLILKQMSIINQLNALDEEAKVATFDNYGIENINAQKANRFAQDYKKDREKQLKEEYKTLGGLLETSGKKEPTQKIPEGRVKVRTPDGTIGTIKKSKLEAAKKKGYASIE